MAHVRQPVSRGCLISSRNLKKNRNQIEKRLLNCGLPIFGGGPRNHVVTYRIIYVFLGMSVMLIWRQKKIETFKLDYDSMTEGVHVHLLAKATATLKIMRLARCDNVVVFDHHMINFWINFNATYFIIFDLLWLLFAVAAAAVVVVNLQLENFPVNGR